MRCKVFNQHRKMPLSGSGTAGSRTVFDWLAPPSHRSLGVPPRHSLPLLPVLYEQDAVLSCRDVGARLRGRHGAELVSFDSWTRKPEVEEAGWKWWLMEVYRNESTDSCANARVLFSNGLH